VHKTRRPEKLYTDGTCGGKGAYNFVQAHNVRVEVIRRPGNERTGTLPDPQKALEEVEVVSAGFMILLKTPGR